MVYEVRTSINKDISYIICNIRYIYLRLVCLHDLLYSVEEVRASYFKSLLKLLCNETI